MPISKAQVKRFKQNAKKLTKSSNLSQSQALDLIARENKFPNWKAVLDCLKKAQWSEITPQTRSLEFTKESAVPSQQELELLHNDLERTLDHDQKLLLSNNRAFLAQKAIDYAIFEPTETGFKKHILDAIGDIRLLFESKGFHDYQVQGQGTENKVIKTASLISPKSSIKTKVSLYRPKTKKGDPRMWITNLKDFADAGDQVAVIIQDDTAFMLNLTKSDLEKSYSETDNIGRIIGSWLQTEDNSVSQELLAKLKEIAKTPLKAIKTGDTAIGMSIEAALGIEANSSKTPDYKGIELKSGRGSKNRTTLFAQVADWKRSACKSSKEILEKYGYERDEDFKLYCTISTQKPNSQGLIFLADNKNDFIEEVHIDSNGNKKPVALWSGEILRSRLTEKHAETFWISAKSVWLNGEEHFELESVIHTRKPITLQLLPLIRSGVITMDHLIKRNAKNRVSEKGPLFKIDKVNLKLLFPEPKKYKLKD